jgi:hypothetical protein
MFPDPLHSSRSRVAPIPGIYVSESDQSSKSNQLTHSRNLCFRKINLKLNIRMIYGRFTVYDNVRRAEKNDSRPFFLSDSFQSVVHYYVSVDGMRQQEGPLKIMKSAKYRTGWEYDIWPRSSKYLEFGQSHVCQSDSIDWIRVSIQRRANRCNRWVREFEGNQFIFRKHSNSRCEVHPENS